MERRLTAILAADVVGYSRLMGEDEVGTLERLKSCRRELIDPAIKEFHGRMIKLMGDGALVEFASVVDAVQCAAAIQRRMADREQGPRSPADPVSHRRQSRRRHRRGRRHLWRWRKHRRAPGGDGRARRYLHLRHRVRSRGAQGGCRLCRSGRAAPQEYCRSGSRLSGSARSRRVGKDRSRATPAGLPRHDLGRSCSRCSSRSLAGIFRMAKALCASNDHPLRCCRLRTSSGDPSQDYFADGITEDLITDLTKLSGLDVIARNSVFAYKGQACAF